MSRNSRNIDMVVEALKKVRPKRLLLVELANQVPVKHGNFDPEYLQSIQREVNHAVMEAKAYGAHTIQAVGALVRMVSAVPEGEETDDDDGDEDLDGLLDALDEIPTEDEF